LKVKEYRDNNNFFNFNKIYTYDKKSFAKYVNNWKGDRNEYNFLDLTLNP